MDLQQMCKDLGYDPNDYEEIDTLFGTVIVPTDEAAKRFRQKTRSIENPPLSENIKQLFPW